MPEADPPHEALLVFIDLDGTIEDSRADMADAVFQVRYKLDLPELPLSVIDPHLNRGMEHLYRNCFPELFENAEGNEQRAALERVKQAYEAHYGAHIADRTRMYAGVPEMLAGLAGRARLVCFTNKPEALSRLLLEALGVSQHFAMIMGGDSCPESKPSTLPMKIARERLYEAGATVPTIMIGDSAGDMRAARDFGARAIWAAWGYAKAAPDPAPDAVAGSPSQVLGLLGL